MTMTQLKDLKCTSCGSKNIVIKEDGRFADCKSCFSEIVINHAEKFAAVNDERAKDIGNLRKLLTDAVKSDDIYGIEKHSDAIKRLIPGDYPANYYYAYARKGLGKPDYMRSFYDSDSTDCTKSEKESIVRHMINYSDIRDKFEVESYIRALEDIDTQQYIQLHNKTFLQKRAEEENYEDIPRDVFVCHRSTDNAIAQAAVEAMERDSNKCWISTRNLRKNDTENYWANIERAIKSCKIFLVISSEAAMDSKDCKGEIGIAKDFNKPRIEYKIDQSDHTQLFKTFFDGCQWIQAFDNPMGNFHQLNKRVLYELEALRNGGKKNSEFDEIKELLKQSAATTAPNAAVMSAGGSNIQTLLKRAQFEISEGDFDKAEELCEQIANIDIENGELWISRLLIENEAKTLDDLALQCIDLSEDSTYKKVQRFCQGDRKADVEAAVTGAKRKLLAKQIKEKMEAEAQRRAEEEKIQLQRQIEINEAKKRWEKEEYEKAHQEEIEKKRAEKQKILRKQRAKKDRKNRFIGFVIVLCLIVAGGFGIYSCAKPEYKYKKVDGGYSISWKSSSTYRQKGDIIIPETYKGKPVVSVGKIGGYSDFNCRFDPYDARYIKSVTMPDTIKRIEKQAFLSCIGIEKITIPESVESIGKEAFKGCVNLKSIVIPLSVTHMGDYVFWGLNITVLCRAESKPDGWSKDALGTNAVTVVWGYTG